MNSHPIEGLMLTAMESMRNMMDVNTIIGEPINVDANITIIPVSKVSFGLATGGSEFKDETIDEYMKKENSEEVQYKLPFGGGAGVGATVSPIAFIVMQGETVRLMPVEHSNSLDKLLDYMPDLFEKVNKVIEKKYGKGEKNEKFGSTQM